MKKYALIVFSILVIAACGYVSGDKAANGGIDGPRSVALPDEATVDPKACAYGDIDWSDVRNQFLWDLSTKTICPKVLTFRYHITLLRLTADQMCLVGLDDAQETLEQQWVGAVNSLGYLVSIPFGPLHAESGRLGMEIYSWPGYNRFALNAEYLKALEQGAGYAPVLAPSRKGLAAVESLIFNREAVLKAGANGELRAEEEQFNQLAGDQRQGVRCQVLRAMLNDVAIHTEILYQDWAKNAGAFPSRMKTEMENGRTQMLLNEVSDSLFYIERVKDYKLGLPLRLNPRCRLGAKCADEVEFRNSQTSLKALRANVNGYRDAMLGAKESPGFVHLLEDVGRKDLADRFRDLIARAGQAMTEVEKEGKPLNEQIQSVNKEQCQSVDSPYPVCRLFWLHKAIVEVYKSDFMTALNLQPPKTEADND